MGKNLFDQIANKSGDIRVSPRPEAWSKLESKLKEENNSKGKIRLLFKQLSIAAALILLAVNAYALISFLNMNQVDSYADPLVLMELPETPNATPNIFPVSNFDEVSISEGTRNDLYINYNKNYNASSIRKSTAFNELTGIWSNDKQVELSIFNAEAGKLFFAIEDADQNKLILKAQQQGDDIVITDKKGSVFGEQITGLEYSKEGFLMIGNQKRIEIKQLDKYTIEIDITSTQANTLTLFLNRAL